MNSSKPGRKNEKRVCQTLPGDRQYRSKSRQLRSHNQQANRWDWLLSKDRKHLEGFPKILTKICGGVLKMAELLD